MTKTAQLRELLSHPPEKQVFHQICEFFQRWPKRDGERQVAVEYALSHLKDWPEGIAGLEVYQEEDDLLGLWMPEPTLILSVNAIVRAEMLPLLGQQLRLMPHLSAFVLRNLIVWGKYFDEPAHFAYLPKLVQKLPLAFFGYECSYDETYPFEEQVFPGEHLLAMASHPTLRGLELEVPLWEEGVLKELAGAGCFGLESLSLSPFLKMGQNPLPLGNELFAVQKPLPLRTLRLSRCLVDDEGVGLLAGSPHFAQLRELSLRNNVFSLEALSTLLASPSLRGLEVLDLYGCLQEVSREEFEALLEAAVLPQLKAFSIGWVCEELLEEIGDPVLWGRRFLPALEELSLCIQRRRGGARGA